MRLTHKNILFETIRQTSFGIDAFDLIETSDDTSIVLKGSPFKFDIYVYGDSYGYYGYSFTAYGPEYPIIHSEEGHPIEAIIKRFKGWLSTDVQSHFEDETAIDLWKEYKKGSEYLDVEYLQVNDNTMFSADDKVRIRFAIEDLKKLIPQKFDVTSEQIEMINEKMDYLIDAASRVSKTDWKGISLGIIASIIIALSLDTQKGSQLWELFMQVFKTILLLPGNPA